MSIIIRILRPYIFHFKGTLCQKTVISIVILIEVLLTETSEFSALVENQLQIGCSYVLQLQLSKESFFGLNTTFVPFSKHVHLLGLHCLKGL